MIHAYLVCPVVKTSMENMWTFQKWFLEIVVQRRVEKKNGYWKTLNVKLITVSEKDSCKSTFQFLLRFTRKCTRLGWAHVRTKALINMFHVVFNVKCLITFLRALRVHNCIIFHSAAVSIISSLWISIKRHTNNLHLRIGVNCSLRSVSGQTIIYFFRFSISSAHSSFYYKSRPSPSQLIIIAQKSNNH